MVLPFAHCFSAALSGLAQGFAVPQVYGCCCYRRAAHDGAQVVALALQKPSLLGHNEERKTRVSHLPAALLFNPEEELVLWNHDPASNS